MNNGRAELARVYEQAVYSAELPAGRVELRVGRPPRGPVPDTPFAIITAWNPGLRRPAVRDNRAANTRLAGTLEAEGWVFHPASGGSEDGRHEEPSFAVMGIDAAQAIGLARRFGQAAIVYWDGARARLVWSEGALPPG